MKQHPKSADAPAIRDEGRWIKGWQSPQKITFWSAFYLKLVQFSICLISEQHEACRGLLVPFLELPGAGQVLSPAGGCGFPKGCGTSRGQRCPRKSPRMKVQVSRPPLPCTTALAPGTSLQPTSPHIGQPFPSLLMLPPRVLPSAPGSPTAFPACSRLPVWAPPQRQAWSTVGSVGMGLTPAPQTSAEPHQARSLSSGPTSSSGNRK